MNLYKKTSKIYVAGHRGLVGSVILRKLQQAGYTNLVYRTHHELDLTRQADVERFFEQEQPAYVFLAAAKVGGILANSKYPAEFIQTNLAIQSNVIHSSWKVGVKRLLFLGSSCIYPRECPQPMREDYLLTGPLESTNKPYAIAKIAGIIQCEAYNSQYGTHFFAVMPTNLYGPNDNFDLETSHVLPALIRKFHLAKMAVHSDFEAIDRDEKYFGPISPDVRISLDPPHSGSQVILWGSGSPRRELLYVDDMADACIFIMKLTDDQFHAHLKSDNSLPLINIGCGEDMAIRELAAIVAGVVGYKGEIFWDTTKPDGTPRKLLNTERLKALGWIPVIDLETGIKLNYDWYLNQLGLKR